MKNPLATMPQRLSRRMPSVFKAMTEMESEMERWMQSAGGWPAEYEGFDFAPSCNIKETAKEFVVQFDIPGVKKEEVKIEFENGRITVSGERKKSTEEKDEKHFLSETYFGSFMRSFTLPTAVDENKIDAKYESGVLTIALPKTQASKSKEVKIH